MGEEQVKDVLSRKFFWSTALVSLLTSSQFLSACTYLTPPPSSVLTPPKQATRQPVSGTQFFHEGLKFAKNGQHDKAVAAYEKACKADPKLGVAYLEWAGSLLYVSDDHALVARLLKQAVDLLRQNPRARVYYGQALMRLKKDSEAIVQLDKALTLRPSLIEPRIDLGELFERGGKFEKARSQLEKVIVMQPTHVQARVRLGQLFASQNHFLQAAQHIEQAALQTKRSAALYRRAAKFYASAGQSEDARRLRAKADQIDPPIRGRNLRPLRKARRFKGS